MILFFFFQAEDGIRDYKVTGVQTCALPIWPKGAGTLSIPPNRPGTPGRYRSRKHHIQAHQPWAATGRLDQRRRNDGRDAGRENARELVDEGNAGVAHLGVEQVAEEGGFGTVDRRVENAED